MPSLFLCIPRINDKIIVSEALDFKYGRKNHEIKEKARLNIRPRFTSTYLVFLQQYCQLGIIDAFKDWCFTSYSVNL